MPTSNLISASKFFGKDRYEYYLNELITEKTLGGHQLSNAQLKEGFKKRKNKISFEKFVDKVISSKTIKSSVGLGTQTGTTVKGRGFDFKSGALIKSPVSEIQKYVQLQTFTGKQEVGNIGEYVKDIIGSLGNIIKVLNAGVSADIKNQEQKRRDRERSKRESVERGLEKGFSAVKKIIEKVVAPVKSILSRIIDFFVKMFLARVVVKLIDWLADPKNASKVKSVIRFLGDWWPALLGSYILFGTSFGRFVRGITGLLARFIVQIGKVAIPGLLKFIARNPAGAAAAALLGVGAAAEFVPGMTGQQEQKTKKAPGSAEDKIKVLQQQKANLNIFQKMQGVGAEIDEQIFALQSGGAKSYGFSGGGFNGFVSGEKGVDKIPAMLSDGEFVMSAGAVQKYGVDTLEAMNAAGGGTNKPKIVGGTAHAAGGGLVGVDKSSDPSYRKNELELKKQKKQKQEVGILSVGVPESNIKKEWNNVFLDMSHPLHYKAITEESYNYSQFKKDYLRKQSGKPNSSYKPYTSRFAGARDIAHKRAKKITGLSQYKPYISRFAGARDIAHERASRIRGSSPYVSPFSPGGMFGGPRMQSRIDYAKSKGKYYSSSDQKTYANYNDALAANKSRMTKLASQQGLDKLSYAGASRNKSKGVRIDAEDKARSSEFKSRGGLMGQLGRFGQRMFGGAEAQKKLDAQQKASDARVKQAGASSIGRYYSSSDGKYYKDYNAAVAAKKARLSSQQKTKSAVKPPVKPTPKYTPAGGGMSGGRSASSSRNRRGTGSPGSIKASHPAGTGNKQASLGIKKK